MREETGAGFRAILDAVVSSPMPISWIEPGYLYRQTCSVVAVLNELYRSAIAFNSIMPHSVTIRLYTPNSFLFWSRNDTIAKDI
jgi:hypothetical protein